MLAEKSKLGDSGRRMDPKLQAMMARRAAMMDDIDDDACYREDANACKATAAAPTEVRGPHGRALDLTRAYRMVASDIDRTPASVADIDMDEHEPEPTFGELPQHSPPAQEGLPPPAPPPEPAARPYGESFGSDTTFAPSWTHTSKSMSERLDYTEHEAKTTPPQTSDLSDYTEPEAKPTPQGELPVTQPSPTAALNRQMEQKSPSQMRPSVHSGGWGSTSDVSSPLSHSSPTAATKVRLSGVAAEEALLQFTANSRCMSVTQRFERISNVTSKIDIVPAAEQEESFSALARRAERERAGHEAPMAAAVHSRDTITTRKLHDTDLGKNLSARVCTVQKVSKNTDDDSKCTKT